MKSTKKILTVLMAGTMAASAFAFTACDPSNMPNNPNNPDNPDNPSVSTDATALINAVRGQAVKYIDESMTADSVSVTKVYSINADGTKGDEVTDKASKKQSSQVQKAKINLIDGDADISTSSDNPDGSKNYSYSFLREWNMFSVMPEGNEETIKTEITDFSEVTMVYAGKVSDMLSGFMPVSDDMSVLPTAVFAAESYLLLALGNDFNGLTLTESKATVDVNKVLYNIVNDFSTYIDSITEKTTVSEVLANKTVKTLLGLVLNELEPAQLAEIIGSAVTEVPELAEMLEALEIDLADILVEPAEGDTAYDYLIKIINSKALSEAVNKVIESMMPPVEEGEEAPDFSLPESLGDVSVSFLLQLADTDLNDIKATVKQFAAGVTETQFSYSGGEVKINTDAVSLGYSETIKVSEAKVEFALDGNAVTAQSINATVQADNKWLNTKYSSEGPEYYLYDDSTVINLAVEIGYFDEAIELKDISECTTVQVVEEYVSETKHLDTEYVFYFYREDDDGIEVRYDCEYAAEVAVKSVVENDKIVGFLVKVGDGDFWPVGDTVEVPVVATRSDTGATENFTVTFEVEADVNSIYLANNEYYLYESFYFESETVVYANTVGGILNGTPSTKVEM